MGNGGIHHKWTLAGNGDENVDTGKGSPRSLSEQLTHTRLTEIYATSGERHPDRFLTRISEKNLLWVPALWWYEIADVLVTAQRRKRLAEADRMHLMELYRILPIQTDTALDANTILRLHALAMQYNLSAYDAAYLELAQRKGLGLATLDQRLRLAAQQTGVKPVFL